MTIQQAFYSFLVEQQLRGNSPSTLCYYKRCIEPFIDVLGYSFDLSSLRLLYLHKYVLHLQQRNISSNSVRTYIKGIKVFLSWLYSEDYININLSEKLVLPKAQRKTIDVLTDSEIVSLFKSFDCKTFLGLRDYCICALLLDSGLRKSEVVRLALPDLHISEGYLIVNGKGNKQRVVPIGLHVRKYLLKYVAMRPAFVRCDSLFLTVKYTPITTCVLERLFKKLKIVLLTPRIRAHLLRHTFATRYLENGGNIYALQQILGHTTLEMSKRYVHFTTHKNVVNFMNYSPLDNLY